VPSPIVLDTSETLLDQIIVTVCKEKIYLLSTW
jgi:hypothetical protein